MPAAVLRAEARGRVHVLLGHHEVNAVEVRRILRRHDLLDVGVGERVALGAVVGDVGRLRNLVGKRDAVGVGVGRVDVEVRGTAEVARQVVENRLIARRPGLRALVPDVVNVGARAHHRAAVVHDAVAGAAPARLGVAVGRMDAPALAGRRQLAVAGALRADRSGPGNGAHQTEGERGHSHCRSQLPHWNNLQTQAAFRTIRRARHRAARLEARRREGGILTGGRVWRFGTGRG